MIIMIDNFDSFTYNLVQYFGQLGADVLVYRNNEISVDEIRAMQPEAIVISPGPCTPREAGVSVDVIKHCYRDIPILGVCLGHQAIGFAFGGSIIRSSKIMHGKTSNIIHDGKNIFSNIANPFVAGRYHSLIIDRQTIPACLVVSAETEDGEIMAVRHKEYPVEGIQFHPESILTPKGKRIIRNFLNIIKN